MKKKIAADLTSLAHRILQLKNKDDVHELHAISKELYEKLTILAFTEQHFSDATPTTGKIQVEEKIQQVYQSAQQDVEHTTQQVSNDLEKASAAADRSFSNPNLSELFVPADQDEREEMELPGINTIHKMVDEFPETEITLPKSEPQLLKNDMEDIGNAYEQTLQFERKVNEQQEKKTSLNDRLKTGLKIGMNDRLGFIKHLFNGSDQDYNRVLSQLNTMTDQQEAQHFIQTMVKPDYNNWDGKETYADRFMEIINAKYE